MGNRRSSCMRYNITDISHEALRIFKKYVPKDTQNMARNATKLRGTGRYRCEIFIDENVAPYSIYTVIPWADTSPVIVRAKNPAWIGRSSFLWNRGDSEDGTPKKNPNEGWIEGAVAALAQELADRLGGKLKVIGG